MFFNKHKIHDIHQLHFETIHSFRTDCSKKVGIPAGLHTFPNSLHFIRMLLKNMKIFKKILLMYFNYCFKKLTYRIDVLVNLVFSDFNEYIHL